MASYTLQLTDAGGRVLMPLTNLRTFAASRIVDGIGGFQAELRPPADLATLQNYHYIERNLQPDWMVQVWQRTRGPQRLWRAYLVTAFGWAAGEDGGEVFTFSGLDLKHLLTRRVVAAYAEEDGYASFTADYADDIMKALVTNSKAQPPTAPLDTESTGSRAWSTLSVAADLSAGPQLDIAVAWQKLLTVSGGGALNSIARAAKENGTAVYFDIVPQTLTTTAATWQFRTYTGQPGRDLRSGSGRVLFDAEAGTLQGWALNYDYSEEVNAVYALGRGDKTNRKVEFVQDAARAGRSPWGRCEGTAEARNVADAALEDRAYTALGEGRPRVSLSGNPVAGAGQEFGRHYDVGDRVLASAKGRQFEALVWSAIITQDEDGQVTETARLQYDE